MAARQAGAVSATSRYEAGQVSVKVWFIPPDDTLLEETRKLQLATTSSYPPFLAAYAAPTPETLLPWRWRARELLLVSTHACNGPFET